jgi:hypothetical protein
MAHYKKALEIYQKLFGEEDPRVLEIKKDIADCLEKNNF